MKSKGQILRIRYTGELALSLELINYARAGESAPAGKKPGKSGLPPLSLSTTLEQEGQLLRDIAREEGCPLSLSTTTMLEQESQLLRDIAREGCPFDTFSLCSNYSGQALSLELVNHARAGEAAPAGKIHGGREGGGLSLLERLS